MKISKQDEGRGIIVTLDNGEDHRAVLRKFEEIPGWSRISFCNDSGEIPDDHSRLKNV